MERGAHRDELGVNREGPVSVRWVDQNKGGEGAMEVRCRLVARDFKGKDKVARLRSVVLRGDLLVQSYFIMRRGAFLA